MSHLSSYGLGVLGCVDHVDCVECGLVGVCVCVVVGGGGGSGVFVPVLLSSHLVFSPLRDGWVGGGALW